MYADSYDYGLYLNALQEILESTILRFVADRFFDSPGCQAAAQVTDPRFIFDRGINRFGVGEPVLPDL